MRISIIFGVLGILFLLGLGYYHESVHVEIFRSYDISSKISFFSHFPSMVTIPEKSCPENSNCELAHNINEAIGYHLLPIYALLFVGLLIIIVLIEEYIKMKEFRWKN